MCTNSVQLSAFVKMTCVKIIWKLLSVRSKLMKNYYGSTLYEILCNWNAVHVNCNRLLFSSFCKDFEL